MRLRGAILLMFTAVCLAGCTAYYSSPPTGQVGIGADRVEIIANDLIADPMAVGPISGEGHVRRWFWLFYGGDTGYSFDISGQISWWDRLFPSGNLMALRAAYYRAADPTGCDMLIFARSQVETISFLGFYKEYRAVVRGQGVQMQYGVDRRPRERNVRELLRARGKDTVVGARPNLVREVEANVRTLGE